VPQVDEEGLARGAADRDGAELGARAPARGHCRRVHVGDPEQLEQRDAVGDAAAPHGARVADGRQAEGELTRQLRRETVHGHVVERDTTTRLREREPRHGGVELDDPGALAGQVAALAPEPQHAHARLRGAAEHLRHERPLGRHVLVDD
jgi:hypothetical protein